MTDYGEQMKEMGKSECGIRKLKIRQGTVVAKIRGKNDPASLVLCFGFYAFYLFPHSTFRLPNF